MLPIRFIAESFNLGVGWQNDTRTVYIITNGFDEAEYLIVKNLVPQYSGSPYAEVNGNKPFFREYEIIEASFEFYADLDELGRCDVAMASVGTDIMPTEERGSISSVTPTGWINAKYTNVEGGYLYNRCHLIGFQLTGENANERNLITGTRSLNIQGMLPFENMIDDYVERTNNNVVYRSTPVFSENNLVADGVLLEAYSVEDNGQGISFCVYCYNVQPGITIDYKTGASCTLGEELNSSFVNESVTNNIKTGVYRTPTGKRYHFDAECGGKNSYSINLQDAVNAGLTPCKKCTQ
ncbi:MAG: DNA/RNA non-specific endonuclease [Clostridia bacterium]|nr:DNA/RNA non-specific endonuclease [Clostridia bacterium]